MKRMFLAFSFLGLVLVGALILGAGLGVAQSGQPVADARPTATPDRPLPPASPTEEVTDPENPLGPDLIVENIEVFPQSPLIGEEATIRVTIANQGTYDVTPGNNFYTDLYIDPGILPIQLGQDGVEEWLCQSWWVPAGGSYTLETTWIFTDVKTYVLYAQVDTDNTVTGEENENNNVLGPLHVEVKAPNRLVHQTHEDFQMGLASSLDISHPEGVIRQGIFLEPYTEPDVYMPDTQIDSPPLPPSHPNNVNQIKPALTSNGSGILFAAWVDGRNGGVFNRDIWFARSDDAGATWVEKGRINNDPPIPVTVIQESPDLAYDSERDMVYAVWQDKRNGDYDIYFAAYNVAADSWGANVLLSIDPPTSEGANQMNPSIAVEPEETPGDAPIYAVWQDQRNGNDDVYLARSDDGGASWSDNYFVTDDPQMTRQNQVAPDVAVESARGRVIVGWEDWRDPIHPEIYAMWSKDEGQTWGIDVPVTIVEPELRTTYRVGPVLAADTTTETIEFWDEDWQITRTMVTSVTTIHVAWQEGQGDDADVYYAYAPHSYDPEAQIECPYPWGEDDFCFRSPQLVSGFVLDSDYVRPPNAAPIWSIEPSWQGQVTLDLVPNQLYWTYCHYDSTTVYSKGVVVAWSDARSYDDWRYEIRTRRVASPEGDAMTYEVCESQVGVVNDNAKLMAYRDDLDIYRTLKPAATGQFNPYISVDESGIFVAWDDDRWDEPLEPGTVRDRDVFVAEMGAQTEGIFISPVIDSLGLSKWYVLSWWGATQHAGDLLLQTRFGTTPNPPQSDVAANGWTRWTGNPSSPYLGCTAGQGCYYDAPGRHIVDPAGDEWPEYRYIQYKVIIRGSGHLTALSQVTIHYRGPNTAYVPLVYKQY